MFADNNRISWLQMRCQFLLAALGVGLLWGIPGFTGREGAVGILIGGALLACWSGILRRQMTVFRDPIRYFGKTCAWLLAGSGRVIWYLPADGWWQKSDTWAGEYLGLRGAGDDTFPCVQCLRHWAVPIMYRHGDGWRRLPGRSWRGWEESYCCWRKAIGDGDGWSAAEPAAFDWMLV